MACPLVLLALNSLTGYGQTVSAEPQWKLDVTVSGVSFYHAVSNCDGRKTVLVKIQNKNSHGVEAGWTVSFSDGSTATAERANLRKVILQAGETQANLCSGASHPSLVINPVEIDPTHAVDLERFSFRQVSIKALSKK